MKISAYHKARGDEVERIFPMSRYDLVYMSKVFTETPDFNTAINADAIVKGGTGYDLDNKLPTEIENTYPDYSLYGITNTAYGFLTRGCPRGCRFCIVGKKEGLKSCKVADLGQFWKGQKEIVLLDANLLACSNKYDLLQQLIDSNAWIDITQGFDARLLTDKATHYIKQLKVKNIHFAWDNVKDENEIIPKLIAFKKATNIDSRKLGVYVLTNFDSTLEQDLYRIYKLRDIGYEPYLMIYNKETASKKLRLMQKWVNAKRLFKQCEKFEDYKMEARRKCMTCS
jgi:hypothetical protein